MDEKKQTEEIWRKWFESVAESIRVKNISIDGINIYVNKTKKRKNYD